MSSAAAAAGTSSVPAVMAVAEAVSARRPSLVNMGFLQSGRKIASSNGLNEEDEFAKTLPSFNVLN